MDIDLRQFAGLAGVPLITGLVQLTKPFVPDTRFWPVVSVAYGVALNLLLTLTVAGGTEKYAPAVLIGIVAGLAASGLFSFLGKTVALIEPGKDRA